MGLLEPIASQYVKKLERPTSRFTMVLPPIATALIVIGSRLPSVALLETATGIFLWAAFILGHMPVVLACHRLRDRYPSIAKRIRDDRKFLRRSAICFAISAFLLWVPLPAFIYFWVYRADFNRLASRIGPNMVDYHHYPSDRIGPYEIELIGRYPGGIVFEIPSHYWYWAQDPDLPYIAEPAFVLETEPGTHFGSREGWYLGGNWYTCSRGP